MREQADELRKIADEIEAQASDWGRQKLIVIYHPDQHTNRLTDNFLVGEYACNDGSVTILIDKRLGEGLQRIRDRVRQPVKIRSAYRPWEYNQAVDGAEHSQHMLGTAADIESQGYTGDQLARIAREEGFTGLGIADNWLHVDVRDEPAEWRY